MTKRRTDNIDFAETPLSYAARLAKYISDPSTIRARTLDYWGRSPSVEQCAHLRAKALQSLIDHRKACETRATPMGRYIMDDDFPCGHERSDDNTYYTGNREACRACQAQAQIEMREEIERRKQRDTQAAAHWRVLQEVKPAAPIHINPFARVVARASELTGIPVEDIASRRRFRRLIRPRFASMYALRSLNISLPRITAMFGMTDHTSVVHALKQVEIIRERDPEFDALCLALEAAAMTKPDPLPASVTDQFVREAA